MGALDVSRTHSHCWWTNGEAVNFDRRAGHTACASQPRTTRCCHPLRLRERSAVAATDANRPETVDLFEVQREMPRIVTKPVVALVREALDWRRQLPIATPEPGGRAMSHRSRVRPCRRSSRASSASASSRPADASCSNCVSHSAASNSMNHALNAASSSAESWATAASISLLPDTHQGYDYRLLAARKSRQTI